MARKPTAAKAPEGKTEGSAAETAKAPEGSKSGVEQSKPGSKAGAAEPPVLVVIGPKEGFRRGGHRFDQEPARLPLLDFANNREGAERFLAILNEPALTCAIEGDESDLDAFIERLQQLVKAD